MQHANLEISNLQNLQGAVMHELHACSSTAHHRMQVCIECYLVFWITSFLVKFPFGNVQIRANSLQIVMDLLHVARVEVKSGVIFVRDAERSA